MNKVKQIKMNFIIALLCVFSYYLVLRHVFPGYFDPFIPHHGDMFNLISFEIPIKWFSLLKQPRFVGTFILLSFSQLGLNWYILFNIILTFINLFLTIHIIFILAERQRETNLRWPNIFFYFILVFSHPGFYFNYTYDNYSTLSYFFLLLSFISWQKTKNSSEGKYVYLSLLFLFCSFFSKETYILSAILFVSYEYLFLEKNKITKNKFLKTELVVILIASFSLLYSILVGSPWVNVSGTNNSYHISLNPYSVAKIFYNYVRLGLNVAGLVIIISSLTMSKDKILVIFLVALGFTSYLPYSILPAHQYYIYYSWVAVPLMYGPILLIDINCLHNFKNKTLLAIFFWFFLSFVTGIIFTYYEKTDYEGSSWFLQQESINRNILKALPKIKNSTNPSDGLLIVGLYVPFHPFQSNPMIPFRRDYINDYFGDNTLKWDITMVTGKDFSYGNKKYLTFNKVNLLNYDEVFIFNSNGSLLDIIPRNEITNYIVNNEENFKLNYVLSDLEKTENDWPTVLLVIHNFLLNKNVERSEFYTNELARLSRGKNPWVLLYQGKIEDAKDHHKIALNFYKEALELAKNDGVLLEDLNNCMLQP